MMECDIIRDLMPLYADRLTSEASNRLIQSHAAECTPCRQLLEEMCAPMEPEPVEQTGRIMEMLRRKQRRKTLLTLASVVLAVIITVWGFLEIRFSGDLLDIASTSEEKILKEMPDLALTDEELALAGAILEIPLIGDAIGDDQDPSTLNANQLTPYLTSILPENGKITEVFVMGPNIYISIMVGNRYICLVYSDFDRTGHIDQVAKTLAVYPSDSPGTGDRLGEPDAVYDLIYTVGSSMTRYRKYKTRHMWFSFLNMP